MKNKKITIDQLARMMQKGFLGVDKRFDETDAKIHRIEASIQAIDLKFSQKIDALTTTLDKFLKRMTDMEEEFTIMKNDLKKMKKVIREKLGVDLI
ncbi:MAG: hypothetical protein A3D44_04405 [Candidatus Staskawiczbacteria bacterium RIFCSPHIGHO2_02_FULL_42_22]|uniref:Uncharacterized protein n=1 Tax=Candidatus Staskawiczbacteria bacterium RIFCSPHIGHO2_02_FULL_42_22 TaxID=1802207 RepID=A0A1G2I4M4_9BACT|nr:MAG: hypothetical protein A3D44_04405 [Candidatus Staskawiczbacteria bacterium RIFCSPHIGHO2_02_FULL_42_22]